MASHERGALDALKSPAAVILSCLLLAQAAAYYLMPNSEVKVAAQPLAGFSTQLGSWRSISETKMEPEVQAVLKSTDSLNRTYLEPAKGVSASLFIAYFQSQRAGVAPHSPKNCLPGSGWAPLTSGTIEVQAPGRAGPVEVNRYVVARGSEKTLVLYWYQTAHRVVASEYSAKVWLVLDALRYHRSDTSLVRIVVPVKDDDSAGAEAVATAFMKEALPALTNYLPK
jgi:EpsI family protein